MGYEIKADDLGISEVVFYIYIWYSEAPSVPADYSWWAVEKVAMLILAVGTC